MGKHVTKHDKLLKKYAGDVFADTQLKITVSGIVDLSSGSPEAISTYRSLRISAQLLVLWSYE